MSPVAPVTRVLVSGARRPRCIADLPEEAAPAAPPGDGLGLGRSAGIPPRARRGPGTTRRRSKAVVIEHPPRDVAGLDGTAGQTAKDVTGSLVGAGGWAFHKPAFCIASRDTYAGFSST